MYDFLKYDFLKIYINANTWYLVLSIRMEINHTKRWGEKERDESICKLTLSEFLKINGEFV